MEARRRVVPVLVLQLIAVLAAAQAPSASPTPSPSPTPTVPAAFASPRATMTTFLESFYAEEGPRLERAVECLDLSELPLEARALKGRELAVKLKEVIDRTRFVVLEEIPDHREGPPYVFLRSGVGEVEIARAGDGRWLFTADTVTGLDELYRATEGEEVVKGVGQRAPEAVSPAMWLRSLVPESHGLEESGQP